MQRQLQDNILLKNYKKDLIIASPDAGGMERARRFAKKFGDLDLVVTDKEDQNPMFRKLQML